MTSFGKLLVTMWQEKNRTVYQLTGIGLIGLIVWTLFEVFRGNSFSVIGDLSAMVFGLVGFVLFILLARDQEHVWTANNYRLIPVSDTKLYTANVLTTLLSYVYFVVIQVVIIFICSLTNFGDPFGQSSVVYYDTFGVMMLMAALLLFGWIFISTIHLVTTSVAAFLPAFRQRLIRVILAIIVFFVVVNIVSWMQKLLSSVLGNMVNLNMLGGTPTAQLGSATLIAAGYFLVSAVILSVVNVYLMKHWVETSTKAA